MCGCPPIPSRSLLRVLRDTPSRRGKSASNRWKEGNNKVFADTISLYLFVGLKAGSTILPDSRKLLVFMSPQRRYQFHSPLLEWGDFSSSATASHYIGATVLLIGDTEWSVVARFQWIYLALSSPWMICRRLHHGRDQSVGRDHIQLIKSKALGETEFRVLKQFDNMKENAYNHWNVLQAKWQTEELRKHVRPKAWFGNHHRARNDVKVDDSQSKKIAQCKDACIVETQLY